MESQPSTLPEIKQTVYFPEILTSSVSWKSESLTLLQQIPTYRRYAWHVWKVNTQLWLELLSLANATKLADHLVYFHRKGIYILYDLTLWGKKVSHNWKETSGRCLRMHLIEQPYTLLFENVIFQTDYYALEEWYRHLWINSLKITSEVWCFKHLQFNKQQLSGRHS